MKQRGIVWNRRADGSASAQHLGSILCRFPSGHGSYRYWFEDAEGKRVTAIYASISEVEGRLGKPFRPKPSRPDVPVARPWLGRSAWDGNRILDVDDLTGCRSAHELKRATANLAKIAQNNELAVVEVLRGALIDLATVATNPSRRVHLGNEILDSIPVIRAVDIPELAGIASESMELPGRPQ